MKIFNFLTERRKRIKIPTSIMILSLFLFVLPLINISYMGLSNNIPFKDFHKIPSKLSVFTNIMLFAPILIAIMLFLGKKRGWYLFLTYSSILIFQNIYSLVVLPSIQNSGILFRTIVWLSLVIYFCKKDISAPYLKMYPRGWRGEKRTPLKLRVKIKGIDYVTADASLSGIFVFFPECPFQLTEEIEVEIYFEEKSYNFSTGVVRIDNNGIGLAFRNLNKDKIELLKKIIENS